MWVEVREALGTQDGTPPYPPAPKPLGPSGDEPILFLGDGKFAVTRM